MTDNLELKGEALTATEAKLQAPQKGIAVEDFLGVDDIFQRVLATATSEFECPCNIVDALL